ncbi:MAG: glutamate-1-semialdehyde 2,1-aminomutase [Candidatus Margulisiibacteriota bacterium]
MGNSQCLFEEAKKHLVGGVNSPVRSFLGVGGNAPFISKGKGSKIFDADGNEYTDYVLAYGPLILGHCDAKVVGAVKKALERGMSFGASTKSEIELAKLIKKAFPSIELLRLVSSGTEATMSAVRLARGFTKKDKIIKIEGCYHGHVDSLLVAAGSGGATFGVPDSLGIPSDFAKNTIVVPFNDVNAVKAAIASNKGEIAALIIEPVPGNMGVVLPREGYLKELRNLTSENGIILIFDEVMSGFRVALGGAQEIYGIKPDITCLGKVIGGGLPIGAFGGKQQIMENLSPLGWVYQAGTLSGNLVCVTCGIETLKQVFAKGFYKKLSAKVELLRKEIGNDLNNIKINSLGSMFTIFFSSEEVGDYRSAKKSDVSKFAKFFKQIYKHGLFFPPSQFEACFVSFAHSDPDIIRSAKIIKESLGPV